jgi:hypothetical protein
MLSVKQIVRVKPGHRVEVVAPEFVEGDEVEVIVSPRATGSPATPTLLEFVDSLPDGPRAFATWDEYEQHLRRERESWDR